MPFVENVDDEVAAVETEAQEAAKQQMELFGLGSNTPPDDEEEPKKKKPGEVDE